MGRRTQVAGEHRRDQRQAEVKTKGRGVFENLEVECLSGDCYWLIGGDWPAPSNTGNLGVSHPLARVSRLHLEKPQLGTVYFCFSFWK